MDASALPDFYDFTLAEFVDRGTYLATRGQSSDDRRDEQSEKAEKEKAQNELLHFMLSGHDRRRRRTARISALANAVTEEQARQFRIRHDFDSMLGMTDSLPYMTSVAVYPVADHRKRIDKGLHIKYTYRSDDGQEKVRVFHHI